MAIIDSLNDLDPKKLSFKLRHLTVGFHFEIAMKTTAVNILHKNKNLLVGFKRFI